ncbi:MAG: MATE family efflux transporter, partial [Oscillospiraceae bacterium]
ARANAIIYMVIACVVLTVGMYFLIEPALLMFGATGEVFTAAKEYSQLIVLGCSIQIFASGIFPILRNCEKAMPVMFITVLGLVSNIILDAVFIYKLNWGIKGAAAATLLAQGISLSIVLVLLVTDKKRPFKKAQFKLQKNIFMEITRIGISPFALFITPS